MTIDTWTCPTCRREQHVQYCPDCGERVLHAHDLTLYGLAEQAVEAVAHLDGRVLHTFRSLLLRPGLLTESYMRGQRKPILAPPQVFLIANLVFFGFQSIFHVNVFSNPLESQLGNQFYTGLATRLVAARLDVLHTTQELYAPVFDHAVMVNAKSLIILMTPPCAILASLLFYARRRPFVTHVVFAIHFYAFWLIFFCGAVPLLAITLVLFMSASGIRLSSSAMDGITSYTLVICAVAYLYVAAGRVYEEHGAGRLLKVLVLAVASGVTVIGYRSWCF